MATEIVRVLIDEYSRKICLSVIEKSLTIVEISKEQGIPVSTCYRKIHELQEYGLVMVEKIEIENRTKLVRFRSTIKGFYISFESGRLEVDMIQNGDTSDRLNEMLPEMRHSVKQQAIASTLVSA